MKNYLIVPKGHLAVDVSKLQRRRLAEDLAAGREVSIGSSGDVTGKEQAALKIQKGKLASQWYDYDRELFNSEIEGMNRFFPQFEYDFLNQPSSCFHNCMYWQGTLKPGILEQNITWEVMAIHRPNHPEAAMGGSVCVYLIDPDIDMVIDALGFTPHHLINDGEGGYFLCTTRAEDMSNGYFTTTAVQTLTWAVKWLTALELVMTGDMAPELFQRPDGI